MKAKYKASKPRFSIVYNSKVRDVYKRKHIFGLISYWSHLDIIKDIGQVEEIIKILNNINGR